MFVLENDDLATKPYQVALVTGTFALQLGLSLHCLSLIFASISTPLTLLLAAALHIGGFADTKIARDVE